eukprot:2570338-Amphidinium_carterae.1
MAVQIGSQTLFSECFVQLSSCGSIVVVGGTVYRCNSRANLCNDYLVVLKGKPTNRVIARQIDSNFVVATPLSPLQHKPLDHVTSFKPKMQKDNHLMQLHKEDCSIKYGVKQKNISLNDKACWFGHFGWLAFIWDVPSFATAILPISWGTVVGLRILPVKLQERRLGSAGLCTLALFARCHCLSRCYTWSEDGITLPTAITGFVSNTMFTWSDYVRQILGQNIFWQ